MNEYKVIQTDIATDMATSVQNFLNQGWRCQGGISHEPVNNRYIQAMVRKKPVKA